MVYLYICVSVTEKQRNPNRNDLLLLEYINRLHAIKDVTQGTYEQIDYTSQHFRTPGYMVLWGYWSLEDNSRRGAVPLSIQEKKRYHQVVFLGKNIIVNSDKHPYEIFDYDKIKQNPQQLLRRCNNILNFGGYKDVLAEKGENIFLDIMNKWPDTPSDEV